jgi:signal transduction histidine kinase
MRIRYKVALVGGIPIAIAAAIAVIAWFLLDEAERARKGAVLAGAAYRELASAMTARDEYVGAAALPGDRARATIRFAEAGDRARQHLDALAAVAREPVQHQATAETRAALERYRVQMGALEGITERTDRLIAEMNARATTLIGLADTARARQHQSNADIIASLAQGDRKLRAARDVVDGAHELRAATAAVEAERLRAARGAAETAGRAGLDEQQHRLAFARARVRNAAKDLEQILQAGGAKEAGELASLIRRYEAETANLPTSVGSGEPRSPLAETELAEWIERLVKVNATEHRALHEETAQLLTYSVQAAETEQATQNIAIATLKLARRAGDALAARDVAATGAIGDEARALSATMAALPISPLIQTEMIEAIERWREGLATTRDTFGAQNDTIAGMDRAAASMIAGAEALNDRFTGDADRIGQFVRTILILGAALGLLVGSVTAFVVARSITGPLRCLQTRMIELAAHPEAGVLPQAARRDELGAMARAVNFFIGEISGRETALRAAKERTDTALAELRETQASLIQAEKLATLGQLVAGVAHEINTPVGIALTTATAVEREVRSLNELAASGPMRRSELTRIIERLHDGSHLLFANLTRAADLVHSFKQVAADRASGERRRFVVKGWVREVVTSLGAVLRKSGHALKVECPDDLTLDSYPGALAQVLTNLIMNALVHAFPDGRAGGRMVLTVTAPTRDSVRFVFADDGVGIPGEHQERIYEPFFTTGRDRGSTGLGLHIVYNLVTATLGGRIEMTSEPGRGTRFTIDLPARVSDKSDRTTLRSAPLPLPA